MIRNGRMNIARTSKAPSSVLDSCRQNDGRSCESNSGQNHNGDHSLAKPPSGKCL